METENKYTSMIFDYIDNQLSEKDKLAFEIALSKDKELARQYNQIVNAENMAKKNIYHQLPPSFTDGVMSRLQQISSPPKGSHFFILLLVVVSVLGSSYVLSTSISEIPMSIDISGITKLIDAMNLTPSTMALPFDIMGFSKFLLYALSFIGLLFFDRAILKPYFNRRKYTH